MEDADEMESLRSRKTRHSVRTATFGPTAVRNMMGQESDFECENQQMEPEKDSQSLFHETLTRLRQTSLDNLEPEAKFPPEIENFIPQPEDMKLGDGEDQLRLMFGNMLSDLILDMGEEGPSISDVPPSLVLCNPFNIELSDFEKHQISEMLRYLKVKNIRLFGTVFEDSRHMLRYLQGNKWNHQKTLEDMLRLMDWRGQTLPIRYATVEPVMSFGLMYIHGRDRCYRPIIVLRGMAMQEVPHDDILNLVHYWLEYIVHNLLYPTRVEQWNVIIDLSDCSFYNVPVMMLKDIASSLQRSYMCRLSRIFVINAPMLFYSIWNIISLVLRESTTQKIKFLGSDFKCVLSKRIHPDQLEEKYGGNCENSQDFHSPIMPKGLVVGY